MVDIQFPNFRAHKQWLETFFKGQWVTPEILRVDSDIAVGTIYAFEWEPDLQVLVFRLTYNKTVDYHFSSRSARTYTMQFFVPKLRFTLPGSEERKEVALPRGFFCTQTPMVFEGQMSQGYQDHHVTFYFDASAVTRHGFTHLSQLPNVVFMRLDRIIGAWYTLLNTTMEQKQEPHILGVKLAVQQLFVLSHHQIAQKSTEALGRNITDYEMKSIFYIRDQITRDLTIKPDVRAWVQEVGIHLTKLEKLFKVFFDTTIYNYFHHQRMEEIRALYLSRQHSLKELAYTYNFTDINHLSNAYKKTYACSPRADLSKASPLGYAP